MLLPFSHRLNRTVPSKPRSITTTKKKNQPQRLRGGHPTAANKFVWGTSPDPGGRFAPLKFLRSQKRGQITLLIHLWRRPIITGAWRCSDLHSL